MTSHQSISFTQVREVFERICEQPCEQHARLLLEWCETPALRVEVQSLLDADASARCFLDEALGEAAAQLLERDRPALRRSIGAYTLLRPIGRGGMGEVYLAERRDTAFEQRVALKLAPRSLDANSRLRFIDEQRMLARLEHPCIARMIDGGIHDDASSGEEGLPYLVMEYVDGTNITDYCDHGELGLDERLSLFMQVCAAVSCAHRNLIVHRDLKPGNIMVTADGLPKLLDFGIAKMLGDDAQASAATGSGLMTPTYAAPEQVLGGVITTSTDIYALGLLLHELVSGARAQALDGCTPGEIERVVCEVEAPCCSVQALQSPRHRGWARRLAGDLDLIVQKALSKEPRHRYESARALADDVERFVRGHAIEARAPTWCYRSTRFVSRHRWQVTGALLILILVVATALLASVSAFRINRALEEARLEAVKADQIAAFLRKLFAAADPEQNAGETLSVLQVLDLGAERIQTELSADPAARALLHTEIGRIYASLGLVDSAIANLERAEAVQRTLGENALVDLATTLLWRSHAEDARGHYDAAEAAARESLDIRRRKLLANDPAIGEGLDRLGSVLGAKSEFDQAIPLIVEAVHQLTKYAGESDSRTLTAMHDLAWLHEKQRDFAGAERIYRRVLSISETKGDLDHPDHLVTMGNLAVALRRQGRLAEAEAYYRDILKRELRRLGPGHSAVADTRYNLAALLYAKGDLKLAEPLFRDALDSWKRTRGAEHPNVGIGLSALGHLLEKLDRPAEAERTFRDAIDVLAHHQPVMSARSADAKLALGRLLVQHDRAAEAEMLLREALDIRKRENATASAMGQAQLELGACLLDLHQRGQALPLIRSGQALVAGDSGSDTALRDRADAVHALIAAASGND